MSKLAALAAFSYTVPSSATQCRGHSLPRFERLCAWWTLRHCCPYLALQDEDPPMPGTEQAEAYKEALRRMVRHGRSRLDEAAAVGLQRGLDDYESKEAQFFKAFPNEPSWALGG